MIVQLRRGTMTANVEVRLRRQERRDQPIGSGFRIERVRAAEDQVVFGAGGCGHLLSLTPRNPMRYRFMPGSGRARRLLVGLAYWYGPTTFNKRTFSVQALPVP